MQRFQSGVSACLLTVMAVLVSPQDIVMAQHGEFLGQAPSESAEQKNLSRNYLLAQSTNDPEVVLELFSTYIESENFDQALAVANRISDPEWQSR